MTMLACPLQVSWLTYTVVHIRVVIMGMNALLAVCGIGSRVYLESMAMGRRGKYMKVAGYLYCHWATS